MTIQKPREIALEVLSKRVRTQGFTEDLLDRRVADSEMPTVDRGLCRELVFGCVRWERTLDHLIDARIKDREPPAIARNILRLGLYQLFWLDRIPEHAAVNESVALAKSSGASRLKGFINAVLRHYQRESESTRKDLQTWREEQPGLGHSHPDWLVNRWRDQFGTEATSCLLEWNNVPARNFARVNTLKIDADALAARWADEGVSFKPFAADWAPGLFFEIDKAPAIAELPSFRDGCFYLQDPSTALACQTLDPQPGESILDLCAAPGGKTTLMAQLADDEAEIVAHDKSAKRLRRVRENCERLGVKSVREFISTPEQLKDRKFDKILLDVPCSNTGVLRRRIDLRWRLNESEIDRLSKFQRALIDQAGEYLKPDGRLVFSTCSIESDENSNDLEFIESRQLTPFNDGVDGAFAGILKT
ncbi:MAG: 16S rRNA (cytosine(967)-C(5))-methyltransferase RsmB [Limisphaerales bacterium]